MKHVRLSLAAVALAGAGVLGVVALVQGATQGGTVQAPRFEVDPFWPKPLPNNWLLGSVTGLAVDSRDHVFVIHLTDSFTSRTETGYGPQNKNITPAGECCSSAPNVLEFDPAGNLVNSWGGPGQGYEWPTQNAGLGIDPSGNIWIGGMGGTDTRILKFTRDGKFVAQFGRQGQAPPPPRAAAADTQYAGQSPNPAGRAGGRGGRGGRGGPPPLPAASTANDMFGGATAFAFDAGAGEVFVADGARNRRIAVVDMNTGAIKRFFGAYGAAPDDGASATYAPNDPPARQFSGVRCVESASDAMIYVCDARNNRIQIFQKDGQFVKEARFATNTLANGAVWDIAFSRDAQQRYLYVADGSNMKVHVVERQSLNHLTSFGEGGRYPGQFLAVSGVATDSKGNLFTVEGAEGKRLQRFVFKGVGAVARSQGVLWPK
jgi:DNA-binding beta-propeller fold protein YncE